MHTDHKVPAEFEVADQSSKRLLTQLLEAIPALRKDMTLPATESWYSNPQRKNNIYVLKEGMLACRRNGKLLFYYNEGDLIGLDSIFYPSEISISTDFAVVVDEYPLEDFLTKVNNDPKLSKLWCEYSIEQSRLFSILISALANDQEGYVPEIRFYCPGDAIYEQGQITEEVYTLLEGRAEIVLDGNLVGKIQSDEVFGTVAGLTSSPRSSSVVANTDCMVAVIPKSHFKYLIYSKPDTVLKLIEDMANALNSVNTRLVPPSEENRDS